ncbi:hypothetical protein SAMN02745225_02323 [Ferrithrix thermotolerans DSM 19514]|uniref:Uncharacterized protein n=1 Tax=Ferrithrix thermotolerans DSM 19514 TaxID=1121881 RepID=A0A1M4YFQ5_9ACTN|nr:hypothetical protein SAMN02745225_02323 [Ferrithrix thermotolerans DSM 19514]
MDRRAGSDGRFMIDVTQAYFIVYAWNVIVPMVQVFRIVYERLGWEDAWSAVYLLQQPVRK